MYQYGTALCILSFTACLLKPQGILNSQGRFAFVSKSIHLVKITHRKPYVKKQKKDATSSKDDELDLLGDGDVESFTGSQADLECAAANLFTSPPRPQPLPSVTIFKNASKICPTHPRYCPTAED